MTGSTRKVRAVVLSTVLLCSLLVGPVTVSAETLGGGNVSAGQVGNAPDVVVEDATLDTRSSSTVEVGYETTVDPSNLAILIRNTDTNDVVGSKTSGFGSKSGVVDVQVGDSATAGVPSSGPFDVEAVLQDTSGPAQLASDPATFTADAPPGIGAVTLGNDGSDNLDLTFTSTEPLGSAESDLKVTVDGPTTGADAYTFTRSDFAESGTGPYTYTLSTTQPYDDGAGTYAATVDDAEDANGLNGGTNGAGSGLTDAHSYGSDTTAPTVSNVMLMESSGSMVVQFDSDEPLGTASSDVAAVVTGPNGKTYGFDRSQFSEGGSNPYTYVLSTAQPFDDGDGTYSLSVDVANDPAGNNGGNTGEGSGLTDTYDYSSGPDSTPPSISTLQFGESNSGDMVLAFDSDEQLGSNTGDVGVTVTGPNGKTYAFARGDFAESGIGPYTYTLSATQPFDDGDGTYSMRVDDAEDAAGNNGGVNGAGSGLTTSYDYGSGGGGGGEGGGINYPPAPSAEFHTTDIDTSTLTTLFVTYNASGNVGSAADVELWFYDATNSPGSPVAKRTTVEATKGLTTIRIPKNALGTSDFTGKIELVDTSGDSPTVLTSSSKTIAVYDGISLSTSRTTLTNDADSGLDVTYDLGNLDPANAEIVVQTTTLNSGWTTVSKSPGTKTGTLTFKKKASGITRNLTVSAFVRDTARGRQVQSSFARTCVGTASSPCPSVVSGSVENAATGQAITGVDVATDWNWFMNGLDWYLHPSGQPGTKEIDGVTGVDSSTMLRVNLTVRKFDPIFLMGNGEARNWSTTAVDDTTTRLTYYVTPADAYWHDEVRNPDPNEWPLANASATTHYDAIVDMTQVSMDGVMKDAFRDKLRGGMVATDAQAFAPPQYQAPSNGNPGKLKISVASPHYRSDGSTTNTGFYTAIIPSGILSGWGVQASQLTGNYQGEDVPLTVETLDDGNVKVNADIHYSSGTVTLTGDPDKPVADAGSDQTVDEGTSVTLDGSASSDDTGVTGYEWDVDDDGTYEKTGETVTHSYGTTGTQTVTLRVSDGSGNTATDTVRITVEAASSGGSSGGGGGGSGGSDSSTTTTATETETTVTRTGDTTSIEVTDPGDGPVTAEVDRPSESGGVSVSRLAIETTADGDYTLDVSTHDLPPARESVRAYRTDVGTEPMGYVQVDHSVADDDIEDVTFEFSVTRTRLTDRDIAPEEVVLYRRHDGEWNDLETALVAQTDTESRFEADSPGLSTFAIGANRRPSLSVTAASVDDAELVVGDTVSVTATVENDGTAAGTTTLDLTAGERVLTARNVTVAANASTTVTLTTTVDDPGEYALAVSGVDAGDIGVAAEAATATPGQTATDPPTTTGSGAGFGPVAAAVALVAAAHLATRRRRR